jgi:hypothetical protein
MTRLPPVPDEVDAFLQDSLPEAFAKVVDRLFDWLCTLKRTAMIQATCKELATVESCWPTETETQLKDSAGSRRI